MRKRYIRLTSRAALWAPRLGVVSVLCLSAAILCHRFSIIDTRFLMLLALVSLILAATALLMATKGLYDLWQRGDKGGMKSLKAIIYSLFVIVPIAYAAFLWSTMPAVNDVSSDLLSPPAFVLGLSAPEALSHPAITREQAAMQLQEWPKLSGRRYDGSPDAVLTSIHKVMDTLGWPIIGERGTSGEDQYISIVSSTKTFYIGFVSDIVIRLTDEGDTTFVDMRSASRGLSRDFGNNAEFIMRFMDALDTEILLAPADQESE